MAEFLIFQLENKEQGTWPTCLRWENLRKKQLFPKWKQFNRKELEQ